MQMQKINEVLKYFYIWNLNIFPYECSEKCKFNKYIGGCTYIKDTFDKLVRICDEVAKET